MIAFAEKRKRTRNVASYKLKDRATTKGVTLIETKGATVETEEISTNPREEAIETDRPIGLTTTNQATTQVRATDVELDLLINQKIR